MSPRRTTVEQERYPGERAVLVTLVERLAPAALRALGPDSLLLHVARRGLRSEALDQLRLACRMLDLQPSALRHRLLAGLVAEAPAAGPPRPEPRCAAVTFVCFAAVADGPAALPTVSLRRDLAAPSPVMVLVRPGTLPSAAARALRGIAGLIEGDRRLLSARYWGPAGGADRA